MTLYCGSGKVDITPRLGVPLAGYEGKPRLASDIHDPLYSRVIVLKKSEQYFVIISLDLVGVDTYYIQGLTEQLYEKFSIPKENIFVHASHTHSGPGGIFHENSLIGKAYAYMNGYIDYDAMLIEEQHRKIIQSVKKALNNMLPCEMYYGENTAEGIGTNRNNPEKPYDSKLKVITFKKEDGQKDVLYHFACHPTIMHSSNTSISADFPGVTSKSLEQTENVQIALFLNGPSADISTRFTRKSATFDEVNRLGNRLFESVLVAMNDLKPLTISELKSSIKIARLKVREFPSTESLETQLLNLEKEFKEMNEKQDYNQQGEMRQLQSVIEGVRTILSIKENLKDVEQVVVNIQVLKIGEIYLLSMPGEVYFETGQSIIDSFDSSQILIVGNTNDHIGYIVPERYYHEANYESYMTLLESDSENKLKKIAIKNLYNIKN